MKSEVCFSHQVCKFCSCVLLQNLKHLLIVLSAEFFNFIMKNYEKNVNYIIAFLSLKLCLCPTPQTSRYFLSAGLVTVGLLVLVSLSQEICSCLEVFGEYMFMVFRLKLIVGKQRQVIELKAFLYRLQIWMMNLLTWF